MKLTKRIVDRHIRIYLTAKKNAKNFCLLIFYYTFEYV